jgi:hypothetical protein
LSAAAVYLPSIDDDAARVEWRAIRQEARRRLVPLIAERRRECVS